MKPRILGYTMARDEWPLLGVAITHALTAGVDHIVVVDHASMDGTATGLAHLQAAWPGLITVLRLHDTAYLQEATTVTVLAAMETNQFDWVYVFDADEFLLPGPGRGLHDLLNTCPADEPGIRYEMHQWVAPTDMDDSNRDHFGRITHRALPCLFTHPPGEMLAHDVEHGTINFFDIPFVSKLIVRAEHAHLLTAGAHELSMARPQAGFMVDPEDLRAGHLPLLSQQRLLLKCRQGQALTDAGFPEEFGWQSQMLRRLELAGDLERFWATHSIPQDSAAPPPGIAASTIIDEALADALKLSVLRCDPSIWAPGTEPASGLQTPTISLDPLIKIIHALKTDRDGLAADRDTVVARCDALVADRDGLAADRAALVADRNALAVDRDALLADRDALAARYDALAAEHATLGERLSAIERSRIWRGTAWYRGAKDIIRPKKG